MEFTADRLLERLDELHAGVAPGRYVIAFSGGLDSTVLLHGLASARSRHGVPLIAVHCNHGLQPDADDWEAHCRLFATSMTVPFVARRLEVDVRRHGTEGAAREARYAALRALMEEGDTVLSAHHEDDQAETLLLNLVRGSGPGGVAGIGAMQPFGRGRLCRPLLDVPRRALLRYADGAGLDWVQDPSNAWSRFDRNWLRQEIMPRLAARWPGVGASLRRSASLAWEAHELGNELADLDLAAAGAAPGQCEDLSVPVLCSLSAARQRNALRRAIARRGLPPLPAKRLIEAVDHLLPAACDAQPLIRWPGGELRRYRDRLFVLEGRAAPPPGDPMTLTPDGKPLSLGPGLGSLSLAASAGGGVRRDRIGAGLEVRFRAGGERFRPRGRRETHRLKKLLQDEGILPWMRGSIPLLYAGDVLVAVGDLWVSHSAFGAPGLAVRWRDRPRIR